MTKSFSQITFDFNPQTPVSPASVIAEENSFPAITENKSLIANEGELYKIDKKQLAEEVIAEEPVVEFAPVLKSGRGRKSQKTFAAEADLVNIPEDDVLFQKQYYTIGEVSQMFKVNASLLRFWEAEFDIIKPRKNRKGDRHFRPIDIKNLQLIYDLLRRRKLTIDGARDFLKHNKKSQQQFELIQSMQKIKSFLLEIKASL